MSAARTLEQVEALLKAAPSTQDRLLAAAKAVTVAALGTDTNRIILPAKVYDALAEAVREAEAGR